MPSAGVVHDPAGMHEALGRPSAGGSTTTQRSAIVNRRERTRGAGRRPRPGVRSARYARRHRWRSTAARRRYPAAPRPPHQLPPSALVVACLPPQIRRQRVRQVRHRQRLQPDPARPRKLHQENPVATEQRIGDAADRGDVERHALLEHADVAGMHQQRLAGASSWLTISPPSSTHAVQAPDSRCSTKPSPPNTPAPSERCSRMVSSTPVRCAHRKPCRCTR